MFTLLAFQQLNTIMYSAGWRRSGAINRM